MGWVEYGGMGGAMPLSFKEINSYLQCMKIDLTSDEIMLIRQMSRHYVSYLNDENPQTKSPYSG